MGNQALALVKEILDIPVPTGLKLSPDGESAVWSTRLKWNHRKGTRTTTPIWIADTNKPKSARVLTDEGYNDRAPQWSPDSISIAFLSDRGKRGKGCAIYLIKNLEEGNPEAITPPDEEGRIIKFEFSPDGKRIAFISSPAKSEERAAREKVGDDVDVWGANWVYNILSVVILETGEVTPIFRADVHVEDFAWNDDGSQIAFTTLRTPHIESQYLDGTTISTLEISTGHVRKICVVPRSVSGLTWPEDTLFYVAANIPDKETSGFAVYSIDLAETKSDGTFTYQRVAHGINSCAKNLAKVGGGILVHCEESMEDQLRFLDGRILVRQKTRIVEFGASSETSGGNIGLVLSQGDLNNPTEVFSVSWSGEVLQLSEHGAVLEKKKPLGSTTFVACNTLDGKETLDGLYLTPARKASTDGTPEHPLPTAVVIHGGPYCRINDAFDIWHPFHILIPGLLAQGHGVLIPNYRGGSSRGERFASYARGGVGTYDEPDIVAMTQHAIELGYADRTKIVAMGWSQGGYLSFLSAVRNGVHGFGWQFRAVVAGAGVADWDSLTITSDIGYMQAETAGGAPWALDKEDPVSRTGSAIWEFKGAVQAGRIPPILIVHGEKDERVPITQAHAFRRALDEAKLPFEFVTYPREGHFFRERKHVEDLMERSLRFVGVHLREL